MSFKVNLKDEILPMLASFDDDKTKLRLSNSILSRTGRRYATYIKKNYLRGQLLNGGTGAESLYGRLRVYRSKRKRFTWIVGEKSKVNGQNSNKLANIYEHEGGYTILPKRRKALRFETVDGKIVFIKKATGKCRPFFSESYDAFPWDSTLESQAEIVIAKELKKAGLA
jgi:hypothetical protein